MNTRDSFEEAQESNVPGQGIDMYIGPGGLGPLLRSPALLIDAYLQPPRVIVSIIDLIDPPPWESGK